MSNKTILQTNNTNLASYTDRVTALISKANSLPEAGGGTEDLSSELTTQNNLITTQEATIDSIISALQGKASGGGSVETCTVTFTDELLANITRLVYHDGIRGIDIDNGFSNEIIVAKNSALYIGHIKYGAPSLYSDIILCASIYASCVLINSNIDLSTE